MAEIVFKLIDENNVEKVTEVLQKLVNEGEIFLPFRTANNFLLINSLFCTFAYSKPVIRFEIFLSLHVLKSICTLYKKLMRSVFKTTVWNTCKKSVKFQFQKNYV